MSSNFLRSLKGDLTRLNLLVTLKKVQEEAVPRERLDNDPHLYLCVSLKLRGSQNIKQDHYGVQHFGKCCYLYQGAFHIRIYRSDS